MATDLTTTTDQADGLRDQAWRALSLHPLTTTSLASQLGTDAPACIEAAIAKIEHEMRPVPRGEAGRKQWSDALDERLRRLAVKVLPTAKPADTQAWREALVDALADLPAMIAMTAAKRAIHRPFRFIGEIEAAVREIAAELIAEREDRLAAFRRHREAIDRALNPPQPLLAAPEPDVDLSPEQIRALSPPFRSLGLKAGFITQEQVDAALSEPDQAKAA